MLLKNTLCEKVAREWMDEIWLVDFAVILPLAADSENANSISGRRRRAAGPASGHPSTHPPFNKERPGRRKGF